MQGEELKLNSANPFQEINGKSMGHYRNRTSEYCLINQSESELNKCLLVYHIVNESDWKVVLKTVRELDGMMAGLVKLPCGITIT